LNPEPHIVKILHTLPIILNPECADRLAKKRIARASGVFIGATATVPIKRESPLHQSADWKKTAVGLKWLEFSNLRDG